MSNCATLQLGNTPEKAGFPDKRLLNRIKIVFFQRARFWHRITIHSNIKSHNTLLLMVFKLFLPYKAYIPAASPGPGSYDPSAYKGFESCRYPAPLKDGNLAGAFGDNNRNSVRAAGYACCSPVP